MKLVDVNDGDSRRAVLFGSTASGHCLIPKAAGSYDLAVGFANSGLPWADYLRDLPSEESSQRNSTPPPDALPGAVPFMPESGAMAAVYSFGYTHRSVNGKRVERGKIDFYHKGTGHLLITDGDVLAGTSPISAGGIEVEYCAIYCVNEQGQAVYLGFALANDFSDVGLRESHRNLANLSKLHPTAVSREVVLGELPRSSGISAAIERSGTTVWERSGVLGRDNMLHSQRFLERLLFGRQRLFRPGMVVYLLLGACISSHKDGVRMQDGDHLTLRDHDCDLVLGNTFAC